MNIKLNLTDLEAQLRTLFMGPKIVGLINENYLNELKSIVVRI